MRAHKVSFGERSLRHRQYHVSGFRIESQLELLGPEELREEEIASDVEIRYGGPFMLERPSAGRGGSWQIDRDQFLFEMKSVARFRVSRGTLIEVESAPFADPGHLSACLLGTCLAALIHQRGGHVLHASAVQVGNSAVLFCGASGAGKSTMAAALNRAGYPLLCEDFCALRKSDVGYAVYADSRKLKLRPDVVIALTAEDKVAGAADRQRGKLFVHTKKTELMDVLPIRAIYLLAETKEAAPEIITTTTLESTIQLRRNCYRPGLMSSMGLEQSFFVAAAELQRQAPVYWLRRSKDFEVLDQVVTALQRHWREHNG